MRLLRSLQVGRARKWPMGERSVLTAFHKSPVSQPLALGALGLAGDEQADLSVHGGLAKAVYAYPVEHYAFWQQQRWQAGVAGADAALPFGALGENLSLQGLLESEVWVGDLLQFADCALRVTQPREPCFKFNAALGFNQASRAMAQSGFCGFYLAVEQVGSLQAGAPFSLLPGPRRLAISEAFQAKMFKHLR